MRSIKKRFGAQICTKLAREDDTETVDCQEDARRLKISKIITGFRNNYAGQRANVKLSLSRGTETLY